MSYKVIEKNEYGVLVEPQEKVIDLCEICKYQNFSQIECDNKFCQGIYYYLPDSEVDKLERENQLMNTTINDLYIESKCYFEVKKKLDDYQKELIDLRCELRVEKEKSNSLEAYSRSLELKVKELEICQHPYKSLERNENGLFCNICKKQISNDPNIY